MTSRIDAEPREDVLEPGDLETMVSRMARIGSCWSPSFSPDGSRVAFISDLTGVPQVWTVSSQGGWPELVTALDDQISRVSWSPDGAWLAFALAPGGGMNQQVYLVHPDGSGLRRLTAGGRDYVLFPDEGHGFTKTRNRIRSEVAIARWFVQHLGTA